MQPNPWDEPSHSIWKVLPLHPQPQPFESFTSYIIRLAQANGLRSIRELTTLIAIPPRSQGLYTSPDYPIRSYYVGMAQATRSSQERLLSTTFHPLIQHFGRSMQPGALHRFLAGSLAPSLRYCPVCLAEGSPPYYSLLWRFLVLPGCIEHEVLLLEQCDCCGARLPLVPSPARLAKCPTCQADLSRGQMRSLNQDLLSLTHKYTQELSMLLSPMPRPLEKTQMKVIGKQCMARRRQQDLSIIEVANLSGLERSVVMYIEQGNGLRASLDDYMRYADVLSCSLLEILNIDHGHALLPAQSEERTLRQIEAAIEQLKRQGEPVTRRNIRNVAGLEAAHLKDSPQVEKLLAKGRQGQGRRRSQTNNQRDEEFVKLVEQAIQAISAQGLHVTQERICDLVGHTRATLMTYPHTAALMKQVVSRGRPHDLQRLVQDAIEQAQALGTSLSHRSISERIGISLARLRADSQVRAIMQRAQNESRHRQENELFNSVEQAIEELLLRGEKLSLAKVSLIVGRGYNSLYRRPHIRELVFSRK